MKTTVSLDGQLRDRLAALAARHDRTMGQQIAAMVEDAEERLFWDDVSAGYAEIEHANLAVVMHDDYPEYADMRMGDIAAEGAHNEEQPSPKRTQKGAA